MAVPQDLTLRLAAARNDRSFHRSQINEYLRMADPSRPRIGDPNQAQSTAADRSDEVDDRYDSTMEEVSEDFASDLIGRLMPRGDDWLTYEPVDALPDEFKSGVEEALADRTPRIFDAIRSSNIYDEALGEWALDQGHGTSGMMIVDPGAAQPFYAEAIGPHQLLLGRGARGLNFKARECSWEIGEAVAFWPNYKWTAKQIDDAKRDTRSARRVTLIETATRVPDPGDEVWKWRVLADNELVHEEILRGRGSCPILASRWRTHSSSAWGIGPLRKAVPDARTLDQERYLVLKNLGKIVDPPISYEDDDLINPEGGISPGDWIPRMQGSQAPQPIATESRMDLAYFEQAGLQDSIRRAGYQSGPRQRGKTPPTLGQWTDEKAAEGRRLEMPTGKLYAEAVVAIVERVEYLLIQRGELDPAIRVNDREIKLRPLNPLSRQQDFEKVQTATQLLTTANQAFGPQVTASFVDAGPTFTNLKTALNDKLVEVRAPEQANSLLRGVLGQADQQPGADAAPANQGA